MTVTFAQERPRLQVRLAAFRNLFLAMHILMSGICGFVGRTLAVRLRESSQDLKISGFDNFVRPGSELNRLTLRRVGIAARHADLQNASDIERVA